jgi:uncharacterized membrane protein
VRNKALWLGLFSISGVIFWLASLPYPWAHSLFTTLCHQDPYRSFIVTDSGLTMAVCSRCFGFYTMLFGNWALILLVKPRYSKKTVLVFLSISLFLNILDVFLNAIGFWVNTLESRFFGGLLLALPIALLFESSFKKNSD